MKRRPWYQFNSVSFRSSSECHQLEAHKGSAGCRSHSAWAWVKLAVPTNTTEAGVTDEVFLTTQQGQHSSSSQDSINPRSPASGICLYYIAQRTGQGGCSSYILCFLLSTAATFLCILTMTAPEEGDRLCYLLWHQEVRLNQLTWSSHHFKFKVLPKTPCIFVLTKDVYSSLVSNPSWFWLGWESNFFLVVVPCCILDLLWE